MLRGDICLVNLDPARSGEANKQRPAVIVSNDAANTTAVRLGRGVVTVVPLTTNVEHLYPFQVALSADDVGLERESKAQAEQVRSVAVDRLTAKIGRVPLELLQQIDEALRLHLAL